MRNMKISWNTVCKSLSDSLNSFYQIHKDKSGEKLYDLLSSDKEFVSTNQFFAKFEMFDIKSVDPLHIFASILGQKSSNQQKMDKIKILFRLFNIKITFDNISFEESPAIVTINFLTPRKLENEKEIWNFFIDVTNGKKIPQNFTAYQNWYGFKTFETLTIFLYCLDSKKYLPIEYNTKLVLSATSFGVPRNFSDYIKMMNKLNKFNTDGHLNVEFYTVSYRMMSRQEKNVTYSENFSNLLQ